MRIVKSSGPDWETVLKSAAFDSRIVPDALGADIAVEGSLGASTTDSAATAEVRRRYAAVLADLERVSGWMPKPDGCIALYDGRLDHVETTIRDQIRIGPLETTIEVGPWGEVVVPTFAEILRVKAWLVISRNAARDYRDAAVLAEKLGREAAVRAMLTLDDLYPQSNGASVLQQLVRQLSEPGPFDEFETPCVVESPWNNWQYVLRRCRALAVDLLLGIL